MRAQAIVYEWVEMGVDFDTGELLNVMRPLSRYRPIANRLFAIGGEYVLEQTSERNMASHMQYFAALRELYDSLPETIDARWSSFEHFRKWCLIDRGFYDETIVRCTDPNEAGNVAAQFRQRDRYSEINIFGDGMVIWRTAKSQDLNSMGKRDFEASKKAVLERAEEFVGARLG